MLAYEFPGKCIKDVSASELKSKFVYMAKGDFENINIVLLHIDTLECKYICMNVKSLSMLYKFSFAGKKNKELTTIVSIST